jgi:hypothetical protein
MDEDARGWVVCLLRPEREEFRPVEPAEHALAWCLVYLMLGELPGVDLAPPT